MINNIVIGNIMALIGSILMVSLGLIKEKKKILLVQTTQIGMFILSDLILGGISGAIINFIGCIRNILCYKNKLDKNIKIILVILSVIMILFFNNMGFIGLLPLISTVTYTIFMSIKDIVKFKYLIIFTMVIWCIYDICIKSYTSAVFDFLSIWFNLYSIYKIKKSKV